VCTPAIIPTYGGVLSAIEKALQKLVEKYREVGKSLWDLVEDQERNMAQLEWRWSSEGENRKENSGDEEGSPRMASEKVRRRELHHLPPVSIVVLFSLFFNCYFSFVI